MIEHGASVDYVEKVCTIRINVDYPYKPLIEAILRQLRSLIYSSRYMYNYLKYCEL
jgi:hypothetical protein